MPRGAASLLRSVRPYTLHLSLLVYTPVLLVVDGATAGVEPQIALGLLTFAVLGIAARRVTPGLRWQVWLCVPIATLFEVLGSLIWGGSVRAAQHSRLRAARTRARLRLRSHRRGSAGRAAARLGHPSARDARRDRVGGGRADSTVAHRSARPSGRGGVAAPRVVRPPLGEGRHVRRDLGGGRDDRDRRHLGRGLGVGRIGTVVSPGLRESASRSPPATP